MPTYFVTLGLADARNCDIFLCVSSVLPYLQVFENSRTEGRDRVVNSEERRFYRSNQFMPSRWTSHPDKLSGRVDSLSIQDSIQETATKQFGKVRTALNDLLLTLARGLL